MEKLFADMNGTHTHNCAWVPMPVIIFCSKPFWSPCLFPITEKNHFFDIVLDPSRLTKRGQNSGHLRKSEKLKHTGFCHWCLFWIDGFYCCSFVYIFVDFGLYVYSFECFSWDVVIRLICNVNWFVMITSGCNAHFFPHQFFVGTVEK